MGDENFWKWLVPVGGGGMLWAFIKFGFPVIKAGWQATAANSSAQINMISVLQTENAALRTQLTAYGQMAAEMALIKYQLEQANQKIADQSVLIERLTAEIHLLKGAK